MPKLLYVVRYRIRNAEGSVFDGSLYLHERNDCKAYFWVVKTSGKFCHLIPGVTVEFLEIRRAGKDSVLPINQLASDHASGEHLFRRCPATR